MPSSCRSSPIRRLPPVPHHVIMHFGPITAFMVGPKCMITATSWLAVVPALEGDLVGAADVRGQVDRPPRPGEPVLRRGVPADPQREQGAQDDDRRVVDGRPGEVL